MHTYRDLLGDDPRGASEAKRLGRQALFHVAVRGLFRPEAATIAASPTTPSASGRATGTLIAEIFGAPALAEDFSLYLHAPNATDPVARAARPQRLLRALAGAASRHRRHRLGRRGAALSRPHLRLSGGALHPEPQARPRRLAHADALRFPRRAQQPSRLGLLARADPDPERLVPAAQPRRRDIASLYFVGAGTHPGAGVPGVVGSAKATAELMLEDAAGGCRVSESVAASPARDTTDAIRAASRDSIEAGSKSFAAAARLFDPVDARQRPPVLRLVPALRRRDRRPGGRPRDRATMPGRRRSVWPGWSSRHGPPWPASRTSDAGLRGAAARRARSIASRTTCRSRSCEGFRMDVEGRTLRHARGLARLLLRRGGRGRRHHGDHHGGRARGARHARPGLRPRPRASSSPTSPAT